MQLTTIISDENLQDLAKALGYQEPSPASTCDPVPLNLFVLDAVNSWLRQTLSMYRAHCASDAVLAQTQQL